MREERNDEYHLKNLVLPLPGPERKVVLQEEENHPTPTDLLLLFCLYALSIPGRMSDLMLLYASVITVIHSWLPSRCTAWDQLHYKMKLISIISIPPVKLVNDCTTKTQMMGLAEACFSQPSTQYQAGFSSTLMFKAFYLSHIIIFQTIAAQQPHKKRIFGSLLACTAAFFPSHPTWTI